VLERFSSWSRHTWRGHDDELAAGHALADVVVGLAGQFDLDAARKEAAERLAAAAAQVQRDGACKAPITCALIAMQ